MRSRPTPLVQFAPLTGSPRNDSMNTVDYMLIAIVVISVVIGALRGFLREAVSLVTWVVAFVLAWQFGSTLAPHLGAWLAQYPGPLTWTARGIIFIAVLLIGAVIGGLLGHS